MDKLEVARTVLILNAQYKECDTEVMGTYDSMDALLVHFSRILMKEHNKEDPGEVATIIARRTADLLGEGEDECVDGRTRYWYEEHEVLTLVNDNSEED